MSNNTIEKSSLNRLIRSQRKLLRIKQSDLALALGFKATSYISKIENDKYTRSKIPFYKIVELSTILNIDLNLFIEEVFIVNKEIKIKAIKEMHKEGISIDNISKKLLVSEFYVKQCILEDI